jgi:hypothetical protein
LPGGRRVGKGNRAVEQNVVYLHEDGKAVRTPVQTGINDDK